MNNDPNEKDATSNLEDTPNSTPEMSHPAGTTITPSSTADNAEVSAPAEDSTSEPQNPFTVTEPEEISHATTPKKSKKKLFVAIAAVIALAAIAGAAWYVLAGNKKDTDDTQNVVVYNDVSVLKIGDTNGPIGLDVLFPNAPAAQASQNIDFQVYEGLVGYSDQKIVPLLATSWTNPDNNTWVFTLKEGVTFHNGKPVTAADVKTSIEELKEADYWGGFLYTIDSISTSDDGKVTIKTVSPDSLLLNRLVFGFIYSKSADETYSGTGAYTIDVENSKTESATKLLAYDNYHQGKPKTRAIEYTIYDDYDALVVDLKNKKIDHANIFKNSEQAAELAQVGYSAFDYESTGVYGISMNMVKTGPLQKKEVREALAYALNREDAVKAASSDSEPSQYILPKSVVGYDETAKMPAYDTAKVKELLTSAGYADGVALEFAYIEGIQSDVPAIVESLNKAGFNKIAAVSYPSPREFVQAASSGDYDLLGGRFSTDLGDGLDTFASLLGTDSSQFPSYSNPEFDAMLESAAAAFKPEEHVQKVQEINKYVVDNFLYLPISSTSFTVYYPKTTNYAIDSIPAVNDMYFWNYGDSATTTN
jgi:peptide/nickel transport system substrate-binding protein